MRSDKTPLSLEQIQTECPAVFAEAPNMNKVSDKYVHIPTAPVLQTLLDANYGVSRAQQTKARRGGGEGYARHLLAFRPLTAFKEAKVGGAVPEVLLLNSHDGQCSYRLDVGLYRFVCANGLIVGNSFETVKIRHRGNIAEQVLEATESIFETYVPKLGAWVDQAGETKLSRQKQNKFAEAAQVIRFPDKPFEAKELLRVRRAEDEGDDLWSVFNRVQENLMRGGIEFKNANGRSCVTKPINRVTKDVIFNRKLWDAANELLPARKAA